MSDTDPTAPWYEFISYCRCCESLGSSYSFTIVYALSTISKRDRFSMIKKFIKWFITPSQKHIVEDVDLYAKIVELENRISTLEAENVE